MALIQKESSRSYAIVTNYLSVIEVGKRSGVNVFDKVFYASKVISGRKTIGYAEAIVHDAYHSKLYHDYRRAHKGKDVPADVFSGRQGEDKCIDAAVAFLKDAKAPEREIKSTLVYKHVDYFTVERTW